MSDAIEHEIPQTADNSNKTELIGRESDVVPGRFGEPLQVTHVQYSRGGGNAAPKCHASAVPVPAWLGIE